MSVALIAHYLGPRLGIGHYLERLLPPLVKELTSRNIEVRILASPNAWSQTPALQTHKELVTILPQLDYSPYKRYFWVATGLVKYCHQQEIKSLVWLSNPMALPWHPPTLTTIHDVNEWKAITKGRWRTALRGCIYLDASVHFAQKLVAISQTTKQDLLHFRPQLHHSSKLVYIPQGIDSQLVNLPPVKIPAPDQPFLLYVGRIDPVAKRLQETVYLAQAIREADQKEWELHLVGGMNESTQAAGEDFLASIKDIPWIHYQGYVSDDALAQWYRQAAAVIFLSDREGFGFPVAEAASMGRWAIISQLNTAGVESGGKAIIAIDPEQPQIAAKKILDHLQQELYPPVQNDLQQWSDSAVDYADEIEKLLP
ncbi:MAG: glycosyltransferase [Cyanobacteria bacterium P01_G01_bin.39]